MEYTHSLSLLFLESTFIFIAMAMLFQQRRAIGQSAFLIAFGMLEFFACLAGAAGLRGMLNGYLEFFIADTVLFMPLFAAFMLVYITGGALAAQRIILGIASFFGLYLYITEITCLQCSWLGFSLTSSTSGVTLETLFRESRTYSNAAIPAQLLQFLLAATIYTKLDNLKIQRFISSFCAMTAAVVLRHLIHYGYVLFTSRSGSFITGSLLVNTLLALWLSLLLVIYLRKLDTDNTVSSNGTLDLVFSFLGGYGRSKELEASLQEWTNRYQLVLENTCETVLLLDSKGVIADANIAAGELLGSTPEELKNQKILNLAKVAGTDSFPPLPLTAPAKIRLTVGEGEDRRHLAASLSPVKMRNGIFTVMIARDITDELKLEEEKTLLAEQLAHSQRLESLGMLAGGVAHDFNNYIHAILGHVDVISLMHTPDDPEVVEHLGKITRISEQAGKLTSALVGFARKGKYTESTIDPAALLRDCLTLINTRKMDNVELRISLPDKPEFLLRGDRVQLQQAFINLILNAADALAETPEERWIAISTGPAAAAPEPPAPPPEIESDPAGYFYISFKDNGCGMDNATVKRIFEPFFTTKPVGAGTGMGLAMVYGIITHHHGWIQVKSSPGRGTEFLVFLPLEEERNIQV